MDGLKIGVGIITMGVRKLDPGYFTCRMLQPENLFIYTDHEKKGPGYARNQCLKHFKDYDYVFLFDDDCKPTRRGWEEYLIKHAIANDVHFMCLPNIFENQIIEQKGEMYYWCGGTGCFTLFSKKALETLGGYNTSYQRYGWEDTAIRHRAKKAGLTGSIEGFAFPLRGIGYIYSEDITHQNPTPNMTQEEKQFCIELNRAEYAKEILGDKIFYEFT